MGVLRGFALILISVLFLISLIFVGTFATLDSSLSYDIVHPQIKSILNQTLDLTPLKDTQDILNNSCINSSDYIINDSNHTFIIPCEVIANGTGAVLDYQLDVLIKDNYYKNYTCSFWKCFKETEGPMFLVSKYSQDYWNAKFYHFLFFSIILLGLLFLLIEKKINLPSLTGVLLILAFIPVANLDSIGKFFLKLIFSSMKHAVSGINSIDLNSFSFIFFSQANSVFLTGLSIGLILIALTIFLKLFKVGFKIGKLFSKGKEKEQISKKRKVEKEESEEETKNKKSD